MSSSARAPQRRLGLLAEEIGAISTTFVHRQIDALRDLDPFVACWKLSREADPGFAPVHVLRTARATHRLAGRAQRLLPARYRFADRLEAAHVLRGLLARHGPALLHVHFGWTAARVVQVLARADVRYTLVLHGSDVNGAYRDPGSPYARRLGRAFRNAEACLFVSEDLRRKGLELGCPPERAEVFHLGVPIPARQARPAAEGRVRIVSVGRLIELKGHSHLLQGFARMLAAGGDAELVVIGDGPERAHLVAEAAALGVAERVRFAGALPSDAVYRELEGAQVYVQSSMRLGGLEEGLGIAIQEAMAAGLAVVGTDTGGTREVLADDETGLLVPERAPEALAAAMGRLVKDAPLRGRLGAAARQRMSADFDLDAQNARLRRRLGGLLAEAS